jgi:hypothetical protein
MPQAVRISGVVVVNAETWYWLQMASAALPPGAATLPVPAEAGRCAGGACGDHCWCARPPAPRAPAAPGALLHWLSESVAQ